VVSSITASSSHCLLENSFIRKARKLGRQVEKEREREREREIVTKL